MLRRLLSILVVGALMALAVAVPAQAYPGYASWYDLPGATTASGDTYESWDYTCASNTYPLGSYLAISRGGVTITCIVTDTGGFTALGRDVDLSYQAASDLGLIWQGVGWVDIQYVGYDYGYYYGKEY